MLAGTSPARPRPTARVWWLLAPLILALAVAQPKESPSEAVRTQAQQYVDDGKPMPARKLLKAELQRLRERARGAAGPAAEVAEGGSDIPYLRLGTSEAQGAAELLADLAGVYQRLGQQAEALAVLEESAEIWRAQFGEGHPRYGMALDRLADAHVQNKNFATAMELYSKLLHAMRSGLGRAHPGYQVTLRKLADTAAAAGKPKSNVRAYAELIELMESQPPDSGTTGAAGGPGGFAGGGASGGRPDGEASAAAAAAESASALAGTRVQYALALASSGNLLDGLRQAELARDAYAESSATRGTLDHAMSMNGVAGILEKTGRYDEAIQAMGEAYEMTEKLTGLEPGMLEGAKRNLEGMKAHIARKRMRESKEL